MTMRNATLITALLLSVLWVGYGWAEEGLDGEHASASQGAPPPESPSIELASAGPRVVGAANPLMLLPGMRALPAQNRLSAAQNLPAEILTDFSNAPNPFDSRKAGIAGQTVISYNLSQAASVTLTIYDLMGFRVKRWTFSAGDNGARQGTNTVTWDASNEAGQKVSKGGYLAQLEVETPQTTVTAICKIGVIH
jgi:hypothetical protein